MKLDEQLARGIRAERILNDELFAQAFKDVEQAILDKWRECPIRDTEGQHELKLMHKLLQEVKAVLETTIADGQLAGKELERKNSKLGLITSWMGR